MKKIYLNYKPLDKSVSLRIVSGSAMQQYNATTGEYVPDHTLVPLVIQPDVYIADPDGVIAAGLKNAQITDVAWYEGSVADANSLASNASYTIDTSASATRGRLTVKRNIPEGEQLTLVFTAKFLDTRTGYGIPLEGRIQLGVSQAVEESLPRLLSSFPAGARLYPTTGQQGLKINCRLVAGDAELQPSFKWEGYAEGAWGTLSAADGYKGITTGTLWIPKAQLGKQSRYRCTATYKGQTYTAEHTVGISYENYWADIIVPGDGEVSPASASVTVRAEVKNNRGTIENPSRYFLIEWFDQTGTKLGTGETLTIQKSKYASSEFLVDLKVSELYGDTTVEPEGGYWVLYAVNNNDITAELTNVSATLMCVGGCTFKTYGLAGVLYIIKTTNMCYLYAIIENAISFGKKTEGVWSELNTDATNYLNDDGENIIQFNVFSTDTPSVSVNGHEITLEQSSEPSFEIIESTTSSNTARLSGTNLLELKTLYTLTFENYNLTMKNSDGNPTDVIFVPNDGKTPQDVITHITE